MLFTKFLNLRKPEGSEDAKISDLNDNSDVIDETFESLDSRIAKSEIYVSDTEPTDPNAEWWLDTKNNATPVCDVYSTEEQRIGTWIDGKPLYRKVIQATLESKSSQAIPHGISNANSKMVAKGFFVFNNSTTLLSAYYSPTNWCRTSFDNTNLTVELGTDLQSVASKYILAVLEYTKTTD